MRPPFKSAGITPVPCSRPLPEAVAEAMRQESPRPIPPGQEHCTFRVLCSFHTQHTFTKSEVEPDPGGDEADFSPTDDAINALQKELREEIEQSHAVTSFEAYAESDELLDAADDYFTFIILCSLEIEHTFAESEIEPNSGSGGKDVSPTAAALKALEQELTERVKDNRCVESFEFYDLKAATDGGEIATDGAWG